LAEPKPDILAEAEDLRFFVDPPLAEAPLLRPIVEYWEQKRQGRSAPLRKDIDPLELKEYLAQIFLVDALAEGEFRFRLLGNEIIERYGRNSTGKTVRETYKDMPEIARWCTRMFQAVIEQGRPVLARGTLHAVRKDFFTFETISLPLSRDGARIDMIFGAARYQARPRRG
jgi:hypothetical protein